MPQNAQIAVLNSGFATPKEPPSKQAGFLATYNCQQKWSFRNSLINYITKNPSNPKVWQKLVQSCKHFFAKNPVLVIQELSYDGRGWKASLNGVEKVYAFTKKGLCKVWVINTFNACHPTNAFKSVSTIISHVYRVDINDLYLSKNVIIYKDFLFLASNCEKIFIFDIIVKNEDDSIVPLEKLVEVMPKIRKFVFADKRDSSSFTTNTVKEIIQIPHFSKIDVFDFEVIPETFDIETFFAYIKKNKHTQIYLTFCDEISEAYKNRIEAVIDEILENRQPDFRVPYICFNGINNEKQMKLQSLLKVF